MRFYELLRRGRAAGSTEAIDSVDDGIEYVESPMKAGNFEHLLTDLSQTADLEPAARLSQRVMQVKEHTEPSGVEGIAAVHLQDDAVVPVLGSTAQCVRQQVRKVIGEFIGRMSDHDVAERFCQNLHGDEQGRGL